jgi:drug/metabolite transporter (DMT)-like permease
VLFAAYSKLPAQIAQPVNFTWPIVLSLFAILFLKEKATVRTFLALLLSFLGVVTVSIQGQFTSMHNSDYMSGILLGLLSAVILATYWIINLQDTRPALIKLFWCFLFGFILILIYAIATNSFPEFIISRKMLYPVYIGLFEMSVTFFIWISALQRAKNTPLLSNLVYLVPILSLGVIRIILKEELRYTTFIGLGLIVAGVLIQTKRRRNKIK